MLALNRIRGEGLWRGHIIRGATSLADVPYWRKLVVLCKANYT